MLPLLLKCHVTVEKSSVLHSYRVDLNYGHENKSRDTDGFFFSYNKLNIISFQISEQFPTSFK